MYDLEIDGSLSLDEINLEIAKEEAGASEFKRSRIATGPGGLTNLVTFEELEPGNIPNPLSIVEQGQPQPPATIEVWAGAMSVEGRTTAVVAYRS